MLLYVDDILLSGRDVKAIKDAKRTLRGESAMPNLGIVNTFGGYSLYESHE